MNRVWRSGVSTVIVGLFFGLTCYAGIDSPPMNLKQTHDGPQRTGLRSVTIVSQPAGAKIVINGDYVGTTPLLVDFAVDRLGRAVRTMELRAIAPQPMITQEVRLFPAAGSDGDASRIPHVVDFDLNVQSVFVIR